MKTDDLENFIRNNRAQFDELEPDPALWAMIADERPVRQKVLWRTFLMRVAAVMVIFVSGYYFHRWIAPDQALTAEIKLQGEADGLAREYQVFLEAKGYYTSVISQKESEVFQLVGNNTRMKQDLENDLSALDKSYASLERDLGDRVASQEVIEAMIQHYRIRLEILEDMLIQLKSTAPAEEVEVHHVL